MKYIIISGSHPRHIYYANQIIKNCDVVGVILQCRGSLSQPIPDTSLDKIDKENFIKHFKNRVFFEKEYFGLDESINHNHIHEVTLESLCSLSTVNFVKKLEPDACFIFGCGMIREPLFGCLPYFKINLHLGISPRYRGSATLFWPFYFLEPNWAGSTFHIINSEPDAGEIIHQSIPILEKGDTIHQVACKVVYQSAEDVKLIINQLESKNKLQLSIQTSTGKKFLNSDFMPQHLRLIYNVFGDKIVDYFLEKELKPKEVKIIKINEGM